ncbi:MAG: NAD-dependent epimerase/dehydratase family protein [Arenimonas sp.]
MRFTVLGGNGFIGSHLVAKWRAAGHEVLVPKHESRPDPKMNLGHVVYAIGLTGDFRSRPYDTIDAHVTTMEQWLRHSNFDSWLYLSSSRVYGTTANDTHEDAKISLLPGHDALYDLSKLLGESLCYSQPRGEIRAARFSNVFGPRQSKQTFLGAILESARNHQEIRIHEHPESAKDYINIQDAIDCIEHIVLHGNHRLYNVASGQNTSHEDIAKCLMSKCSLKVSFEDYGDMRKFPLLNTDRLQSEFSFSPRSLLADLPYLATSSN